MAIESSPIRLPMTLQQFIKYTGWEDDAPRERMGVALKYFQSVVSLDYLSQPVVDIEKSEDKRRDPNPWLLPRSTAKRKASSSDGDSDRVPIELCVLMQTIDFFSPVSVAWIPKGVLLKAFHTAPDPAGSLGHFYTLLPALPGSLAIPYDQGTPRIVETTCSFKSLTSTVSDAYVDWAMSRGVPPEYRHGGGRQFYIWRPELKLRPVRAPAGTLSRRVARGLLSNI